MQTFKKAKDNIENLFSFQKKNFTQKLLIHRQELKKQVQGNNPRRIKYLKQDTMRT